MAFMKAFLILACAFLITACAETVSEKVQPEPLKRTKIPDLYFQKGVWTDDLDGIRKRRVIRALVSSNQTNYFITKDFKHRGFEYELLKQYEKKLNSKLSRKQLPLKMVFIPVPFKELLPALLKGRGDIAAAGLTITKKRAAKVAFSSPYLPNVSEILVSHKGAKPVRALKDLSGRKIYVFHSSSYATHLRRVNQQFQAAGRSPIEVAEGDSFLQTEDILEMVNAGILDFTIADNHLAKVWASVLPNLVLYPKIKINEGGKIAWAVRPNNRKLLQSINGFIEKHKKGSLFGNIYFRRYFKGIKWIKNPTQEKERKKLEAILSLLQKYSDRYGFDWLMVAAQAYQESELDHSRVSPAGAIGIMQVLPSTAADSNVNISDINKLENNIHAGVKYLNFLRKNYYSKTAMRQIEQVHFSHAAYNAGPRKVQQMRQLAKKMGLNSNIWFDNVEQAAWQIVGRETVQYVANIHKYYMAYKLVEKKLKTRGAVKKQIHEKRNLRTN